MEKKFNAVLLSILSVLLIVGSGCAHFGGLAVAGKVSTLGLGGELTKKVTSNVNARFGFNTFNYDMDFSAEDVEYDLGLDFLSYSALVDWHVFNGSFRISGGALINQNEFSLDATPTETITIGDTEYTIGDIGTLSGEITFEDVAPYIGIGWGNAVAPTKKWGITTDFGIAFTGAPDVSLSSTGVVSQADLDIESVDIEDELSIINIYPVISIGLFYRF